MVPGGSIAATGAGLRSSWGVRRQSRVQINTVRCQAQAGLGLETGTSLLGTGTSPPPGGRAEGAGQSRGRGVRGDPRGVRATRTSALTLLCSFSAVHSGGGLVAE